MTRGAVSGHPAPVERMVQPATRGRGPGFCRPRSDRPRRSAGGGPTRGERSGQRVGERTMDGAPVRIVLVEKQSIIGAGIRLLLAERRDFALVHLAANAAEALALLAAQPDAVDV